MLLTGSQRGFGQPLATHLMNVRENDHVTVAEVRGTFAQDLHGAFAEVEATAQGTRCEQPFFHVIFNPPEKANLTRQQFFDAFAKLETELNFQDHPRAVVFHEKKGREHAHVVYGRIYISNEYETGRKAGQLRQEPMLKAKNMDFFKQDLRRISQDLHREFGIEMPAGLINSRDKDPLNYDLATWQQATRLGEDPRDLKNIIGQAYKVSDSNRAFNAALEQHAMQLAKGDKRGFVVVHHSGEALPLHRFLGVRQKDIRARLGQPSDYHQTVDQARKTIKQKLQAQADRQFSKLAEKQKAERMPLAETVSRLKAKQQAQRQVLKKAHLADKAANEKSRADNLRKGVKGLWDRVQLQFKNSPLSRQHAAEIEAEKKRRHEQFHILKTEQVAQRQQIQKSIVAMKEKHQGQRQKLRTTLGQWLTLDRESLKEKHRSRGAESGLKADFGNPTKEQDNGRSANSGRGHEGRGKRGKGLEL